VLLDRRKVKFWQRIVFGAMAFLMAAFLVVGYSGVLEGCSFRGEEESATDAINKEIVAQEAAVAAAPDDAQELVQLGELYVERGNLQPLGSSAQTSDWDKAAAAYARADELLAEEKGPDVKQQRLNVLTKLVDVQLFLEDYAGATSTYGIITGVTPKDAQAYFEMASVAINAGDTSTALLAFNRFLELDPDSPDAPAVEEWIEQNSSSTAPTE
jgi:tetratricopeptide (TPR) repeat protein